MSNKKDGNKNFFCELFKPNNDQITDYIRVKIKHELELLNSSLLIYIIS